MAQTTFQALLAHPGVAHLTVNDVLRVLLLISEALAGITKAGNESS